MLHSNFMRKILLVSKDIFFVSWNDIEMEVEKFRESWKVQTRKLIKPNADLQFLETGLFL